jgi:hypothetical protein
MVHLLFMLAYIRRRRRLQRANAPGAAHLATDLDQVSLSSLLLEASAYV